MALTPKRKYEYLKERFNLKLKPIRGIQEFEVNCEFCSKRVSCKAGLTKTGNASNITLDGTFHHKDGDAYNNTQDNILVLCRNCRKHFQYWGMVQRYLKKIGRRIEDLPDCTRTPAIFYRS